MVRPPQLPPTRHTRTCTPTSRTTTPQPTVLGDLAASPTCSRRSAGSRNGTCHETRSRLAPTGMAPTAAAPTTLPASRCSRSNTRHQLRSTRLPMGATAQATVVVTAAVPATVTETVATAQALARVRAPRHELAWQRQGSSSCHRRLHTSRTYLAPHTDPRRARAHMPR